MSVVSVVVVGIVWVLWVLWVLGVLWVLWSENCKGAYLSRSCLIEEGKFAKWSGRRVLQKEISSEWRDWGSCVMMQEACSRDIEWGHTMDMWCNLDNARTAFIRLWTVWSCWVPPENIAPFSSRNCILKLVVGVEWAVVSERGEEDYLERLGNCLAIRRMCARVK